MEEECRDSQDDLDLHVAQVPANFNLRGAGIDDDVLSSSSPAYTMQRIENNEITRTIMRAPLLLYLFAGFAFAWTPLTNRRLSSSALSAGATTTWFPSDASTKEATSLEQLKVQILQLGAALDRGQSYNPTSGEYYKGTMDTARIKIRSLIETYPKPAETLKDIEGEWELVLTTVPHGIFRSSPFFLAIQESYTYAETQESFGEPKANLFFRLHELQTCSWGVSKIGRVAQRIDPESGYLYSEFDTSIFSLTVIPILGWFKLLPTFGGCVVTAAKCEMESEGKLKMEVDYTTSRPVPGLSGLGEWIWKVQVPVGKIWKLLPWNKGRSATCSINVKYVDNDFRIVEDIDGELFVYTRPVVPRSLHLSDS